MAASIADLVVKYSADTKDAEAGADRVNSSIGKVAKVGAALAVAGGALLGGFFAKSVGAAANFEQGMDGVAASLGGVGVAGGITADQFSKLQEEALRIGQTTSVGATDAARAMDLLAKSGIPVEEIYNGVAQGVVDVSTATGESLDQSAATYGALQNLFRDTGITSSQMSDTIVNAMNASNMSLSEFQTGIARMGPVIAATGMSFGDSAGALAYFNSIGYSAAEVGTSLTAAFTSLVAPTNEQAAAQQALGISAFDAQGQFVGFPAIMDQVQQATAGMTDEQRAATIAMLFGADAADLMTEASKRGGKELKKTQDQMNKTGTAATAAATRMDNLKGDVEQLKGAFETLSIRVGTALLPALRGIVQGLTGGIEAVTRFAQSVIKLMDQGLNPVEAMFRVLGNRLIALGGGQGILAEVGRGFQRLGDFARQMGFALGDVMDAFQALREGDFPEVFDELREAADTAFDAIRNLGSIALDWVLDTGVPTIVGWVVDNAGDVWGGIKSAVGWAWDGLADLGGWTLNVGVPSVTGAITGIAGRLGDWLRSYIYGGGIVGDGTGGPEPGPGGGVMVDIAQITLRVLDAIADVTPADVQGQIQKEIDSIATGAKFAFTGFTLVLQQITGQNIEDAGDIPAALQVFIDNTKKEYNKTVDLLVTINTLISGDDGGGGGGFPGMPNPFGGGSSGGGGRVQKWVDAHFPDKVYKTISAVLNYEITNIPGDLADLKDKIVEQLNGIEIVAAELADLGSKAAGSVTGAISDGIQGMVGFAANIKDRILQEFDEAAPQTQDLSDWAMDLASTTKDAIVNGIKGMVGFAAGIKERIGQEFNEAKLTAADLAGFASGLATELWTAITTWIDANITPDKILDYLKGKVPGGLLSRQSRDFSADAAAAQQGTSGKNDFSALTGGTSGALAAVKALATQTASAMTQFANAIRMGAASAGAALTPLRAQFTALQSGITTSVTAMGTAVRAQFTAMQAALTAQTTAMTTAVRTQFTAMQAAVAASMTAMVAQVNAQFTQMTASGTAQVNALRAAVQSGMSAMAAAGSAAMSQFANAVRSGFSQAAAAAQSGVAAIRGAVNSIGSLYGQGFSIGSSFGQGVAAGLYSMLGAVQAAAAAIVAAAAQAAAAAGRISSPSKLMRDEIGVPLAQGVIVGLDSQRSNVASAFASMIPVDARLGRGYRGAGSSPYAARSSAGAPVVQNVTIYTLKADEYQRLLKQAQNGDRAYQQQLPRSRDRQLGSTR